ncbi:hypothetical protein ACJ41O_009364 [Fusarium nematophilum]
MTIDNAHKVPIVDLSPFTSNGDADARRQAADHLNEKLHVNGCVGITGHGVSPGLLRHAFELAKTFFDMPYEEKMKAPHPDAPVPHRGYSGPGREVVAAKTAREMTDEAKRELYSKTTDFKESFEIGSEENSAEANIWPPEDVYPGFRELALKFYWELNNTALGILEALIMSLHLTEGEAQAVRALHTGHTNQLRLLHYPPMDEGMVSNEFATRLGAHKDWSTFTLLFQDSSGGLMFLDRASDTFVDALPMDNVLYMNVGDMLERISNGIYPSALHQVVSRNHSTARYSIPYFVSPTRDGVIEPQASLVESMGCKKFEPVTAVEYSTEMFKTINVYK